MSRSSHPSRRAEPVAGRGTFVGVHGRRLETACQATPPHRLNVQVAARGTPPRRHLRREETLLCEVE
jgi:hypothetical protein